MALSKDAIEILRPVFEAGFNWGNIARNGTLLTTLYLADLQVWDLDTTFVHFQREKIYERDLQTTLPEIDQLIAHGNAKLAEFAASGSALTGDNVGAGTYLGLSCAKLLHWIHVGEVEGRIGPTIQELAQHAVQLFTERGMEKNALWSNFVAELTDVITQAMDVHAARDRGTALGARFTAHPGLSETVANMCLRLVRRLRKDTSRLHASRDFSSLTRILSFGIGFCEATSTTVILAQMHGTLARLYTDINNTADALGHRNCAYDYAIDTMDVRIHPDSYKQLVDDILNDYVLLIDDSGLSDFYLKLDRTWLKRFGNSDDGSVPLQKWARQRKYRLEKVKFRKDIRNNSFYNTQKLVVARFAEPLPDDIDIATDELYYRSNLGMNYGCIDAAREACEKLDSEPIDYFTREGKWERSPQDTWYAFETCIEHTAFQNSLRFFEHLQKLPNFLNLSSEPSEHELKDYKKLVQVARLYIFQERWAEAFALLVCSCSLVAEERQRIPSDRMRSRHFDSASIEKVFDWTVWVCLHFHGTPSSPRPKDLDSKACSDSWAQEALRFAEMGKARLLGDTLQEQDIEASNAVNSENLSQLMTELNVFQRLSAWLDPETLVVHMTLCDEGLGLICCSVDKIHHAVWLQGLLGFGRWDVQRLTSIMYMVFRRIEGGVLGWESQTSTEQRRLRTVIDGLSKSIILPIKDALVKTKPKRICFVPASQLSRVPFASLELDSSPLIMQYTVYQAPSLSILESLFKKSKLKTPEIRTISVIIPARYENQVALLENAVECVNVVDQIGSIGKLQDALGLSRDDFLERFKQCDILHVGTHGNMNHTNPSESYISLQQDVSVADMEQATSISKLIFFSACLTGLGHSSMTDDLIGFQAQILKSGASAFAGLIWNGNALGSLFFSHFLYERLTSCSDASENLADIFAEAQRRLRALKRDEAHDIVQQIERRWKEHQIAADLSPDILKLGTKFFDCYPDLSRDDFKHMYFWAPFTFIGYPIQVFRP